MGLNLALPVFDVARVFQIRVDLILVVKIISQGGMDLGRSQVAKALEDLVDAHAELIISGDAVDGDPRPRDERPSPGDAGIRRDIGVIQFLGCQRHVSPSLFSESLPLPQTEIIPRKQLNFICRIEQIGESVNLKIMPGTPTQKTTQETASFLSETEVHMEKTGNDRGNGAGELAGSDMVSEGKGDWAGSRVASTAKWSVLVYMAGDNNLDGAALRDIEEMARAGSDALCSVVNNFSFPLSYRGNGDIYRGYAYLHGAAPFKQPSKRGNGMLIRHRDGGSISALCTSPFPTPQGRYPRSSLYDGENATMNPPLAGESFYRSSGPSRTFLYPGARTCH